MTRIFAAAVAAGALALVGCQGQGGQQPGQQEQPGMEGQGASPVEPGEEQRTGFGEEQEPGVLQPGEQPGEQPGMQDPGMQQPGIQDPGMEEGSQQEPGMQPSGEGSP